VKRAVDEGLVTELESAIADTGALVVCAQKYRRGTGPEGAALLGAALALGDEARRLHRRDALDAAGAARLLAEARALAERPRALLAEVRAGADYRAAVAGHRAGGRARLARLRPAARLETDEDLRVELAPADYARWRDAVARALAAAGVPVEAG